jgi:hypothetical protein
MTTPTPEPTDGGETTATGTPMKPDNHYPPIANPDIRKKKPVETLPDGTFAEEPEATATQA